MVSASDSSVLSDEFMVAMQAGEHVAHLQNTLLAYKRKLGFRKTDRPALEDAQVLAVLLGLPISAWHLNRGAVDAAEIARRLGYASTWLRIRGKALLLFRLCVVELTAATELNAHRSQTIVLRVLDEELWGKNTYLPWLAMTDGTGTPLAGTGASSPPVKHESTGNAREAHAYGTAFSYVIAFWDDSADSKLRVNAWLLPAREALTRKERVQRRRTQLELPTDLFENLEQPSGKTNNALATFDAVQHYDCRIEIIINACFVKKNDDFYHAENFTKSGLLKFWSRNERLRMPLSFPPVGFFRELLLGRTQPPWDGNPPAAPGAAPAAQPEAAARLFMLLEKKKAAAAPLLLGHRQIKTKSTEEAIAEIEKNYKANAAAALPPAAAAGGGEELGDGSISYTKAEQTLQRTLQRTADALREKKAAYERLLLAPFNLNDADRRVVVAKHTQTVTKLTKNSARQEYIRDNRSNTRRPTPPKKPRRKKEPSLTPPLDIASGAAQEAAAS